MQPEKNNIRGFFRVGHVENKTEYFSDLKKLIGRDYFSYNELHEYIENEIESQKIQYYNKKWEKVSDIHQADYKLIDTGLKMDNDANEIIYGSFKREVNNPEKWTGVIVGNIEIIKEEWLKKGNSISNYTYINDFKLTCEVINKRLNKNYSFQDLKDVINDNFISAYSSGKVYTFGKGKNQISYFKFDLTNDDNDVFWFVMDFNNKPERGKDWFGLFLNNEDELYNKIFDNLYIHMMDIVFETIHQMNKFLFDLAEEAIKEDWEWLGDKESTITNPILKSFIENTYYKLLLEQKEYELDPHKEGARAKIIEKDNKIFFNSGLLNRRWRQIIIIGEKDTVKVSAPGLDMKEIPVIKNLRFATSSDKIVTSYFSSKNLPPMAEFFDETYEVVFKSELEIHLNDKHIFEDNIDRIKKYAEQYESIKTDPKKVNDLVDGIFDDFESAKEKARLLAERNYKLAVPQFWKETGQIQFLLPIFLNERCEGSPDCALALEYVKDVENPHYRGATILTLSMAYNNARLIAKPDNFWLDPAKSNDSTSI